MTLLDKVRACVGAEHADAVDGAVRVRPGAASEIVALLALAVEAQTQVGVGEGGLALSLERLDNILHLDETSLLCTAQAGMRVDALEARLAERGLTLGALSPATLARTLGALVAAPRASEAGPRHGRLRDECAALGAVLADGTELQTRLAPRKATGPDVTSALFGSRGELGVITEVTLRIARRGEARHDSAWHFAAPASAIEAARRLLLVGARPADIVVDCRARTLSVTTDGPPALAEAERQRAHELAVAAGGAPVPHRAPPRWPTPWRERALDVAALAALDAVDGLLVGWHLGGATLVSAGEALPAPAAPPAYRALQRILDPHSILRRGPHA